MFGCKMWCLHINCMCINHASAMFVKEYLVYHVWMEKMKSIVVPFTSQNLTNYSLLESLLWSRALGWTPVGVKLWDCQKSTIHQESSWNNMPHIDSNGNIKLTSLYAEFEGEHPSNLPNVNDMDRHACLCLGGMSLSIFILSCVVEWNCALMCDLLSSLRAVLGLLALQHRNSSVNWGMTTQIIEALSLNTF